MSPSDQTGGVGGCPTDAGRERGEEIGRFSGGFQEQMSLSTSHFPKLRFRFRLASETGFRHVKGDLLGLIGTAFYFASLFPFPWYSQILGYKKKPVSLVLKLSAHMP